MVSIRQRPADTEDRAVPGHWEGDLIRGARASAIATLAERSSRLVLLVKLEAVDADNVAAALRTHIDTLPAQLRRSLTWDQGKEMARHVQFTVDTGLAIYFCDPNSPWQRGTNENTNGLLRQYFPKRSDLRPHSQRDFDAIAAELNGRPRQTLAFMTPSEKYAEAVALTPLSPQPLERYGGTGLLDLPSVARDSMGPRPCARKAGSRGKLERCEGSKSLMSGDFADDSGGVSRLGLSDRPVWHANQARRARAR